MKRNTGVLFLACLFVVNVAQVLSEPSAGRNKSSQCFTSKWWPPTRMTRIVSRRVLGALSC
jgi:hypothetical protein